MNPCRVAHRMTDPFRQARNRAATFTGCASMRIGNRPGAPLRNCMCLMRTVVLSADQSAEAEFRSALRFAFTAITRLNADSTYFPTVIWREYPTGSGCEFLPKMEAIMCVTRYLRTHTAGRRQGRERLQPMFPSWMRVCARRPRSMRPHRRQRVRRQSPRGRRAAGRAESRRCVTHSSQSFAF